jgi:hypothetical protein
LIKAFNSVFKLQGNKELVVYLPELCTKDAKVGTKAGYSGQDFD